MAENGFSAVPTLDALNESLDRLLKNKNIEKLVSPSERLILDHLQKVVKTLDLRMENIERRQRALDRRLPKQTKIASAATTIDKKREVL